MWTPEREFPENVDAVRDADPPVSCDPPPLQEIRKAMRSPGGCVIYAEMLKAGRSRRLSVDAHCVVFHLEHGDHPHRQRRGVFVPIWKGKDDT